MTLIYKPGSKYMLSRERLTIGSSPDSSVLRILMLWAGGLLCMMVNGVSYQLRMSKCCRMYRAQCVACAEHASLTRVAYYITVVQLLWPDRLQAIG